MTMALYLKKIEKFLLNKESRSSVFSIILDYAILMQKLENLDRHSWYFKKGVKSYRLKLTSLNEEFERSRMLFNENTMDDFLEKIRNNNTYIASVSNGKGMNAVVYTICNLKREKNKFFKELIHLKSKTEVIMTMDYYLQNPEELLKLSD